jgi:hypothetical protein
VKKKGSLNYDDSPHFQLVKISKNKKCKKKITRKQHDSMLRIEEEYNIVTTFNKQ